MLFNSLEFVVFFAVFTAVFFTVPKRFRNLALLLASYFFYLCWNVRLIFLILFTTLVSYLAGRLIESRPVCRKMTLCVSLVLILGILFFFKYYNFVAVGIGRLAGAVLGRGFDFTLDILLPVGISFYTFQTLSYVIDIYRVKISAEKDFLIYALYVSFFPQLVAGPIERPGDLIPQLRREHSFSADNFIAGFRLMFIGFFEKIAVADMLGLVVNRVYGDIDSANGLSVAVATLLFSVQILCDFKGYSDIARGVARVYGITLSKNFDSPYRASSVRDFWRRWHITLSTWFRDYLYIPLGGSRVGFVRSCFNIAVVFLASGLWHGAALTYLIWGGMHAVFQICEKLADRLLRHGERPKQNVARVILTFVLVSLSWVVFRADSVSDAFVAYSRIFTDWSFSAAYFTSTYHFLGLSTAGIIFGVLIILFYMSYGKLLELAEKRARPLRYFVYAAMAILSVGCFIYLQCTDVPSSFIYFQF